MTPAVTPSPPSTPTPTDFSSVQKANEYSVEALKQIITLSSAVLALTITFIKDALGAARPYATFTFLVPMSWFFLVASIWFSWIAVMDAANTLGASSGITIYVFDKDIIHKPVSEVIKRRVQRARTRAGLAQTAFLLGMATLTAFALFNWQLFFTSPMP